VSCAKTRDKEVALCDESRSAPGVGTALSLLVVALTKQE
jgi:hypothetical protein